MLAKSLNQVVGLHQYQRLIRGKPQGGAQTSLVVKASCFLDVSSDSNPPVGSS